MLRLIIAGTRYARVVETLYRKNYRAFNEHVR